MHPAHQPSSTKSGSIEGDDHQSSTRMAHAARLGSAPADEKADPIQIGLFRLQAIVQIPNPLSHLIEQAGRLQWRRTGFHGKFIPVYLSSISTAKPADKRVAEFSPKRCIGTRRMYRPSLPGYITLCLLIEERTHAYLGVDGYRRIDQWVHHSW